MYIPSPPKEETEKERNRYMLKREGSMKKEREKKRAFSIVFMTTRADGEEGKK